MWTAWGKTLEEAVAQRWGVRLDTARAAIRLVRAARARGTPVRVTSGYRTPQAQSALYDALPPGEAEPWNVSRHSREYPATALDFSGPAAELVGLDRVATSAAGFHRALVHRGTGWHLHAES